MFKGHSSFIYNKLLKLKLSKVLWLLSSLYFARLIDSQINRKIMKGKLQDFLSKLTPEQVQMIRNKFGSRFSTQDKEKLKYYLINNNIGNWSFLKGTNLKKYKNKTLSSKERKLDLKPFKIKYDKLYIKRQVPECLYSHNELRRIHGLPPLLWNGDLAYRAEEWALVLAERDSGIAHSPNPDENYLFFGENVYGGMMDVKDCSEVVYKWYSEISSYNFESPDTAEWMNTGHFVQIIWPETLYLGVGMAYTKEENIYVVAQYMQGVTYSQQPVPKPNSETDIKSEDLIPPSNTHPRILEYRIPKEGGWTSWEETTLCSVTCGEGVRRERRYCINPNANTLERPKNCGEGPVERIVPCERPECPEYEGEEPVCDDISENCDVNNRKNNNCMEVDYWEWMKANCKNTCGFCRPCKNVHVDCAEYSMPPYNFCTDERYRNWMLVNCAKSCGYCEKNMTTIYDTDCIDLSDECNIYAIEKGYCMDKEYSDYMKVNCKESCKFCRECKDTFEHCPQLANDYGFCTDENYSKWMLLRCPKMCGFCFERNNTNTA